MRLLKMSIMLAAVMALAVISPGMATEKAIGKAYNYTDQQIELMDPGSATVHGKIVKIRDVITRWILDSSDPRLDGITVVSDYNGNFDQTGSGPVWGTLRYGDEAAGFEARFTGEVHDYFLGKLNWIIKIVGYGTGIYEGQRLEATEAVDMLMDGSSTAGYGVGEITERQKHGYRDRD
jgi:hypothetical protein